MIDKKSDDLLLSRLRAIEKEDGFCSEDRLKKLAIELGIPLVKIYEVATFYSFLDVKPKGRHVIRVCKSPSCYINGSDNVIEIFQKLLGIKVGQTSADNKFTLEFTSCIGCCDEAPAAMIDGIPYTKLNEDKIKEILERCR